MTGPALWTLLSDQPPTDSGAVLDRFLGYLTQKKLELYPAQEEAVLELLDGKNVILNTPTGSGKSLVALALHFDSLAHHRKSIYTCPIKALVNEKFLALCKEFGPERVGMVTGDASANADAPILCCTAEILANMALRLGDAVEYADIIMDEFHYYADRDRGMAWQIPLLTLTKSRFLLMSATLGETTFFEKALTKLTDRETVLVQSTDRPVPLDYEYRETPLHETVSHLITHGKVPIYLVNFTQKQCAEVAQNFMSLDFCTKEEKKTITAALEGMDFGSPYGKEIQRVLKHGIGLHHAGLLPKYRILVERLAQQGLLKIISGTDTLGVGVNVPIRSVLFTQLCKYDGQKTALLTVRDFKQISGRAGRKGFDTQGTVVAQAPEHVIENLRMEAKEKKFVKRKPPEFGYVPWTKESFEKCVNGQPEQLVSRFQINHAILLNVLSRPQGGFQALKKLVRDCHEPPNNKKKLRKTGFELFRSLVDRQIITLNPLKINVDLQEDFSLNHALALYLIDTIALLDPTQPDYALDLLTLVESIVENPEQILRRQLDRIKTLRMAEMKMEGIEYDQRMEELEKLEYPKPNREFIYGTFNDFSAKHPWVGQENIRPKSIGREMFETFQTFSEYIRDYDLHRIEGLLLRYLSEIYKVLIQTVPDLAKTEEVDSMIEYFRTLVRDVDSSLLDEWERLKNPAFVGVSEKAKEAVLPPNITRDMNSFTVLVRNELFRFIRALASGDYAKAITLVEAGWTAEHFEKILQPYYEEHKQISTDPKARAPSHLSLKAQPQILIGQQVLVDPEGHNDWQITFEIDLVKSAQLSKPVITVQAIAPVA